MSYVLSKTQTVVSIILIGLLLVVTALVTMSISHREPNVNPTTQPTLASPEQYLVEVNNVRSKAGKSLLTMDVTLNDTAKLKAEDMANKNYFEHDLPDGTSWSDFIRKHRPNQTILGENISQCYMNYTDTMRGLINSEGHYKTMVTPEFKYFGSYSLINPHNNCMVVVHHFSS